MLLFVCFYFWCSGIILKDKSVKKRVAVLFLEEMALGFMLFFFTENVSKESFRLTDAIIISFNNHVFIYVLSSTQITYCYHQIEHSTKPSGQKNQKQTALLGEMHFQPHP